MDQRQRAAHRRLPSCGPALSCPVCDHCLLLFSVTLVRGRIDDGKHIDPSTPALGGRLQLPEVRACCC